jgi:predicted aspartyl protease
MGTFRTECIVANIANRAKSAKLLNVLVDTGAENTWVPGQVLQQLNIRREKKDRLFVMANGQSVTRSIGFAVIEVGDEFTVDEVVFGEPGDMTLLGARSLEGLNLAVDPVKKKLVAAGPLPAATPRKRRK